MALHAPAYLHVSRHRVFYLRWPLPKALHPQGRASTVKVSLETRDKRRALQLARSLGYSAERLIAKGAATGMTYEDIRAAIKEHFRAMLERRKAGMAAEGRLDAEAVRMLQSSLRTAQDALERDTPLSLADENDDELLGRFIGLYGLPIQKGSPAYRQLEVEFKRGWRDHCEAVLEHDKAFDKFTFGTADEGQSLPKAPVTPIATLREVGERYIEENIRGDRWAKKTEFEKGDHIALLYEILGAETDIRAVTAPKAREVKETLLAFPKNRNKNPKTKGLSLAEAIVAPGIEKLNVQTINKYLATYAGLFIWAKNNGYVDDAVFSGFTIRQTKKPGKGGRDAFSADQVSTMLAELVHNKTGLIHKDYQKWGPLIGLYTGARLNEISQIHLSDIRKEQGIWCFDVNDDDDGKQLKTGASKRLVPIHSRLIDLGLLKHVEAMREKGAKKLFPDFSYCPKNGWGCSLGRWFNDTFLKKIGLTDKGLVFHSLRHTVVTFLMQANIPEPIVKAIIGHAQAGVTQQNYFKDGYTLRQLSDALEHLHWPEL
ncbi:site-specific integrase [Magnetospirillum sulfuroxidans]|uniref:Site-specific integrase n=1 Tax=Magnetospirillum sulfuroxidans TaxID=611300 RepID=A0ABS5IH94_9PROT|nr:site-specific integrase [Magnetospirillum sulfuroxidans]MBR9973068.1 site-specific integrase [Magnetospirillum sulfuroxidans]